MRVRAKSLMLLSTLIIWALVMPVVVAMPAVAWDGSYPLTPADTEVSDALSYLASQQNPDGSITDFGQSAWVTMAIAAAGDDPHNWANGGDSIVDYLAANAGSASTASDYARMILAITAAEEDPTDFAGMDFVALLEGEYDEVNGHIGVGTALGDDIWGIMALISAGRPQSDPTIVGCAAYLKSHQNGDGGWGWNETATSDGDTTASAVMALIAAGEPAGSTEIGNALAYLKSIQNPDGGFAGFDGDSNADTDAWCIDAIVAAGQTPVSTAWKYGEIEAGNSPVDHLLSLQDPVTGAFNWKPGDPGWMPMQTNAAAIVALLGQPYPVKVMFQEAGVSVKVRIEGENATIWSGEVTVTDSTIIDDEGGLYYFADPTALGALDEASRAGGFSYTVHDWGWGIAITAIDGVGDWDNGPWWMFIVDGVPAQVGADAFILNETSPPDPPHHEVLFAFTYTFSEASLNIAVDKSQVAVDEEFTVTVTYYDYYDAQAWSPLEGATVHADQNYLTGPDGTVEISVDHDATLEVFAEKDGYIRSDKVTVTVGTGGGPTSEAGVALGATIIPAISIEVEPSAIYFGELGPRDTSGPHPVTIANTGAWTVLITAEVTDETEDLFEEGLKLDDDLWDLFEATIERDGSEETIATLTVPEDYVGVGEMSGTLIFWATEAL